VLAPPRADALVEELRRAGELPEVVEALDAGDLERALDSRRAVPRCRGAERERLREVAVALFEQLGQDDPVGRTTARRLASRALLTRARQRGVTRGRSTQ
jgi:hypothetical protein